MALNKKNKLSISIIIPFTILALVFGILVWKKIQYAREIQPLPIMTSESISSRTGILFFLDSEGLQLVREGRELDSCVDQNDCLTNVMEELLSGSVSDFELALPESTALISAHIDGEMATIDLNRSFADDLSSSGSNGEMLAVYSIVNTVAVNFPLLKTVKLTIDGNSAITLKHLDLREPLQPDYSLEKNNKNIVAPELKPKTKGTP